MSARSIFSFFGVMRSDSSLVFVGKCFAVLSVFALAPAFVSASLGEHLEARWFFATSALCGSASAATFLRSGSSSLSSSSSSRIGRARGAATLVGLWFALPPFAALPFFSLDVGAAGAWFEAVSGITTTGMTILESPSEASRGIVLWRSLLQFYGGGLTLIAAISLVTPPGLHRLRSGVGGSVFFLTMNPEMSSRASSRSSSTTSMARGVLPIYVALTLASAACFAWGGVPAFEAICLALSTVSTGGFSPSDGGLSAYDSSTATATACIFMLLGASSVFVPGRWSGGIRRSIAGREAMTALLVLLSGTAALGAATFAEDGVSAIDALGRGAYRAISLATTTGLDDGAGSGPSGAFAASLLLMAMGGAAYSTSGGLKAFRVGSLARQAMGDVSRLGRPRGARGERSRASPHDREVRAVLVIFLLSAAFLSCALAASGAGYESASSSAIAALTNTAMLPDSMTQGGGYVWFDDWVLVLLGFAMIAGRAEFLALLAAMELARRRFF